MVLAPILTRDTVDEADQAGPKETLQGSVKPSTEMQISVLVEMVLGCLVPPLIELLVWTYTTSPTGSIPNRHYKQVTQPEGLPTATGL